MAEPVAFSTHRYDVSARLSYPPCNHPTLSNSVTTLSRKQQVQVVPRAYETTLKSRNLRRRTHCKRKMIASLPVFLDARSMGFMIGWSIVVIPVAQIEINFIIHVLVSVVCLFTSVAMLLCMFDHFSLHFSLGRFSFRLPFWGCWFWRVVVVGIPCLASVLGWQQLANME